MKDYGWNNCGGCIGTLYTDQFGNATGDGNTYVSPDGVSVGGCAAIPGWMIAAAVGVVLVAASMNSKGKR